MRRLMRGVGVAKRSRHGDQGWVRRCNGKPEISTGHHFEHDCWGLKRWFAELA